MAHACNFQELVVGSAWKTLLGSSSGPALQETETLKKAWSTIDLQQPHAVLDLKDETLVRMKGDTLEFLYGVLDAGVAGRHDYGELAELVMLLLGAADYILSGIRWRKPGANHRARWMASCLYALKMFAWHKQLRYDKDMVERLRRFAQFICLVYVTHWLRAPCTTDAPINNLVLIQTLRDYARVDGAVAAACLKTLGRHLWYLCEETVPFALFSERASDTDKRAIALQITDMPAAFKCGVKPKFPLIENISTQTTLSEFVGPGSHHIFYAVNTDTAWLSQDPNTWENIADFKATMDFVKGLKSVNDASERAIKLITDYNEGVTCDEESRQHLLQVVEYHRRAFPVFTKKCLDSQ